MKDRFLVLIIAVALLTGLGILWVLVPGGYLSPGQVNTTGRGVPDPAADYCLSLNYSFVIRPGPDGGLRGACILPGGIECDEGDFYRGRCPDAAGPGEALVDPAALYCLGENQSYVIRESGDGTVDRLCVFPDGSGCDARAYAGGTCRGPVA